MITDPLTERRRVTPDRTALVDDETGTAWTYNKLSRSVAAVSTTLPDIATGDRVALLLETSRPAVLAIHACLGVGATVIPLNPTLGSDTIIEQLAIANPQLVITASESDGLPTDRVETRILQIDDPETQTTSEPTSPVAWGMSDPMVQLFTSGTTGEPKLVRLTTENLLASAIGSAFRLGVTPADDWLVCLPIYHMGGLAPIIRSTLYGTSVTIHEGFDPDAIGESVANRSITGISVVPTQLHRLIEAEVALDSLRFVLLGGAPASPALIARCEDRGISVYPTYGLTETASQVTTATPEEATRFPGTVGRPLLGTTVTIVDGDGQPRPDGDEGEIVVSGPTVTPGYVNDPDTDVFGEQGLHTGDIGYLEDGRLWITGRASDVILTGGEQVFPREVGDAIRDHPAVDAVAVVGLDDPDWGERVAALVVAGGVSEASLESFVRDRLAGFKIPKTWAFTDRLPRTVSGTVDRAAVRDLLRGVNNPDDVA